jgi:DNA-binding transcriptional LysR family regulator
MSVADPLPSHELAAFAAAVETGTIHGAAEALNLTQSAATKRIASLERRLGVRLFDRSRIGVLPTEVGRLLYPESKHVLTALSAAERVAANQAGRARLLRLAASQTTGEFLVPGWLAAFRASEEDVRVQLDIRNSPAVLRAVLDDRVEIGFVEGMGNLDAFDTMTLVHDEIVAIVATGHRWARRRSIPAEELPSEPFLTREAGSGTRAVAEAALTTRDISLDPSLELASTESLKRAVLTGGFTLLSRIAVKSECEAGTLVARPVDGVDLRRALRVVRLRGRTLTDPAAPFWRYLASRVCEQSA